MFDRYNLVHFDVAKPIVDQQQGGYENNLKAWRDLPEIAKSAKPQWDEFEAGANAEYQISGSFDLLFPIPEVDRPEDFANSQLLLQSLCFFQSDKGYFTKREGLESILLSYTFSGEGSLAYGDRAFSLRPGSGFVIDCRKPHEYHTAGSEWEHIDIHFWGFHAELLYECYQRIGAVCFSLPRKKLEQLVGDLLEVYTKRSAFRNLFIGNALSNLMCAIMAQSEIDSGKAIPETYQTIAAYLDRNYVHPINLDALSKMHHISKYHLSREFKKYIGFSPIEYLISLRVQHAAILLAQTDLKVEEVCVRSGFGNLSNFIEQMKKKTGLTPAGYRKMLKSNGS